MWLSLSVGLSNLTVSKEKHRRHPRVVLTKAVYFDEPDVPISRSAHGDDDAEDRRY